MACTSAKASAGRARARIARAPGSPCRAAWATVQPVIWPGLGHRPDRGRTGLRRSPGEPRRRPVPGRPGRWPSRRPLARAPSGGTIGAVADRHLEMPDLAGTPAESAIDPVVDDQRTADAAAHRHVKQRRVTPCRPRSGTPPGPRHRHRCGRRPPGFPGPRGSSRRAGSPPSLRSGRIARCGPGRRPPGRRSRRPRRRSPRGPAGPRPASAGNAPAICSRMPDAPRAGSTSSRFRAAMSPRPRPMPSCSFVPPISIPSNHGSAMRSARCAGGRRGALAEKRRYRSSMIQWKTTRCSDSAIPMSSTGEWRL